MEYYELPYSLDREQRWLLYFTNDHDGVATDKENRILSFPSQDSLATFARKKRWKLRPATQNLDFDQIRLWLGKLDGTRLDCPALYATWNLLGDLASSVGLGTRFLGYDQRYESVHEELFFGCNLPGMSSGERPYHPRLTPEEVKLLQEVLRYGLDLFVKHKKDLAE